MDRRILYYNCLRQTGEPTVFSYLVGGPTGYFTIPQDLETIASHEWSVTVPVASGGLQASTVYDNQLSNLISVLQTFEEYGIKTWLDIEFPFGHGGNVSTSNSYQGTGDIPPQGRECPVSAPFFANGVPGIAGIPTPAQWYSHYGVYPALWWTTVAAEYEARFGPQLDEIEEQTGIVGYEFEEGFDTGIQWLRARTKKKIVYWPNVYENEPASQASQSILYYQPTADWRYNQMDGLLLVIETPNGISLAPAWLTLREGTSWENIPWGVTTQVSAWYHGTITDDQASTSGCFFYVTPEVMPGGDPSQASNWWCPRTPQLQIISQILTQLKFLAPDMGIIETGDCWSYPTQGNPLYEVGYTLADVITFYENMNMGIQTATLDLTNIAYPT